VWICAFVQGFDDFPIHKTTLDEAVEKGKGILELMETELDGKRTHKTIAGSLIFGSCWLIVGCLLRLETFDWLKAQGGTP
jgi:hypothetical protein